MKLTVNTETKAKIEVINVTQLVADHVKSLGDGLLHLFVPHTTTALILSEDDAELRADIERTAAHLLDNLEPYTHIRKGNPNAAAHIFSALAGCSMTLAVENGQLALGTYQNMLLIELDGPKTRQLELRFWPLPAD
jgi:secondary thiamine-phosphate synthase enzyme